MIQANGIGRLVAVAMLAVLAGCGARDGLKELEAGKAAFELKDFKKAERLFEKSAEYAPQNVDVLIYLARVKLELGELEAAQAWVDKAAIQAAGDVDVKLLGAQIAWHRKNYDDAARLYIEVANDAALEPRLRSQGWAGCGVVEMTRNEEQMTKDACHMARIAFLQSLRFDRKNASAWYHLGMLYRGGFDYKDAALEQFNFFVRLEADASPLVQKVHRNIIPGLQDAIRQATTERPGAAKRNSAASAAAQAKADDAWKRGSYKLAREQYQKALDEDVLSYPAALGLAKAWLKTDTTKSGMERAFASYKQACILRTSAVSTFLAAGDLATKLGYYGEAVEIYSRAVASNPASLDAIDGLIRALRRVGGKQKLAIAYQRYRDGLTPPAAKK